jgi:hypothetical protein
LSSGGFDDLAAFFDLLSGFFEFFSADHLLGG